MKDMIIVTGAAGFIGANILAELEAHGHTQLVAVDWFENADKWRNVAKRSLAGIVLPEQLPQFLADHAGSVRAVVHMGAISATTERDVDLLLTRNIQYTVMLWDWCAAHDVPFIYASSAATYGALEDDFSDDDSPAALARLRPLNPYGWSKKAVDDIFAGRVARGEKKPPQWVGLKFFNVYGPNEYHKGDMRSVAVKLFETIRDGKAISLFKSYRAAFADGEQRRDFIYVKDCARAVRWFLEQQKVSGIFNLGCGEARSFLDVARAAITATGSDTPIQFIEMPEAIRDRYQYFTEADMHKLRAAGMDFAFHTLEEGMADYFQNYFAKTDPYR